MVGSTVIRPKSDRLGFRPTEIRPFGASSDRNYSGKYNDFVIIIAVSVDSTQNYDGIEICIEI